MLHRLYKIAGTPTNLNFYTLRSRVFLFAEGEFTWNLEGFYKTVNIKTQKIKKVGKFLACFTIFGARGNCSHA